MSEFTSDDIAKFRNDGMSQYTYFLIAVAGASIGYCLTKLDNQHLSWWLAPGLLALSMWVTSFYCGIQMSEGGLDAFHSNYTLALLRENKHPNQPKTETELAIAKRVTKEAMNEKVRRAAAYAIWQRWTLYLGVGFFIVWRVIELCRFSVSVKP